MQNEVTLYCAIPHRPGIDTITHGQWGLDWGDTQYVHEKYGEFSVGSDFTNEVLKFLPSDYEKMFKWPEGHSAEAISLDLRQEHFTPHVWEKILVLIRKYWPKTTGALSI